MEHVRKRGGATVAHATNTPQWAKNKWNKQHSHCSGRKSNTGTMVNTGLGLINNSQNRAALTFCLTLVIGAIREERFSQKRVRWAASIYLFVSYSSFSHFVVSVYFICSFVNDLFSLSQPTTVSLPHTGLSCALLIFSLPVFLVGQAAGGCVDVRTSQTSGPGCLEAATLSASVLDNGRIRLAWRDIDNNLQVTY